MPAANKPDPRRWIYGVLDFVAAGAYWGAILTTLTSRHASATIHLHLIPMFAVLTGIGMCIGKPLGRKLALWGGGLWLGAAFLLLVRICVSAAFLSGVYGSFGKAAASLAMVIALLLIETVCLLPIIQVKYLMSRAGRRTYR